MTTPADPNAGRHDSNPNARPRSESEEAVAPTLGRPAQSEDEFAAMEARWQARWAESGLFELPTSGSMPAAASDPQHADFQGPEPERPAFYALEFFPYPSGEGLSVGHLRNYVGGDVVARMMRMRGYEVLHPMGWDAFGLPAENEARDKGRHPVEMTRRYAANYRRQLERIGAGYDWSREIFSSDPDYYRWTQWIFLRLYERGLAYRGLSRQWFCPECQTVLANEQVEWQDGKPICWRAHDGVHRREVAQWFFKITEYAQQLLDGLDDLDWPPGITAMQRHWIGRREGAEIDFKLAGPAVAGPEVEGEDSWAAVSDSPEPRAGSIRVFTTRPDTIYGVTAIVLAPEHPWVGSWLREPAEAPSVHREAIRAYVTNASRRSEIERQSTTAEKTGVDTGHCAIHPLSGERLPVFVADYVLPDYGSGAVMLVPAHDQRDAEFAEMAGLSMQQVVVPDGATSLDPAVVMTEPGILTQSGPFDGMSSDEACSAIVAALESEGRGRAKISWRMRDWSVGRQRFWGAPIPIVHCADCGEQPVPDDQLPVRLPEVEQVPMPGVDESGRPLSPLAAVADFVETDCPSCGKPARRETDTLDGFACSSWYFLRFASPEPSRPFDPEVLRRWLPVDLYVGGAEHAVMHLLYARFWTRALHDMGLCPVPEPFRRLRNQGMIQDETGQKMSKSRPRWLITPDDALARHGADAVRAALLFLAPFGQDVPWSEEGVAGIKRWLRRVTRLMEGESSRSSKEASATPPVGSDHLEVQRLIRETHVTIREVSEDLEAMRFNTALAKLMRFTNLLRELETVDEVRSSLAWTSALSILLRLMAPVVPHLAEEMWARCGGAFSIIDASWPEHDPVLAEAETVEIGIQVDGVLRERIQVSAAADRDELRRIALACETVLERLTDSEPARVVVVPGRLVNVVTVER